MTIKILYKSHFKVSKNFFFKKKNKKKHIFVKNALIFLLFSKIFFKNCFVSFFFKKENKTIISLLKAPSRHKKFFHQIFSEIFFFKIFFKFKKNKNIFYKNCINFFKKLNNLLNVFGNNILNKVKFTLFVKTKITNILL